MYRFGGQPPLISTKFEPTLIGMEIEVHIVNDGLNIKLAMREKVTNITWRT